MNEITKEFGAFFTSCSQTNFPIRFSTKVLEHYPSIISGTCIKQQTRGDTTWRGISEVAFTFKRNIALKVAVE